MDREERDRQEQEERARRKKALREAQMKKKKQEEQMMIGGGIILLAVLILVIVLVARGCSKRKEPGTETDPKTNTESTEAQGNTKESETPGESAEGSESAASEGESAAETQASESTDAMSSEGQGETASEGGETQAPESDSAAPETQAPESAAPADTPMPVGSWDLSTLNNDPVYFGYAKENQDPETHIPTDWAWYETQWGQFNVDWIQDTSQKIIYLTMDEGFPNEYTTQILDILAEKNVKACFFLTKMFLDGGEQSSQQIQRMINEGHVLGNHTVSHRSMPSLSIEEQTQEIQTVNQIVRDQFGYELKLFRFPEGVYSQQCLGLVDNLGMKTCFWSYAYNDYSEEQPPVEESLQAAIDGLHPGAIYLLHANSSTNTAFLARWIDAARAAGFEFGVYPQTPN